MAPKVGEKGPAKKGPAKKAADGKAKKKKVSKAETYKIYIYSAHPGLGRRLCMQCRTQQQARDDGSSSSTATSAVQPTCNADVPATHTCPL
jgi:hypothetical protein